MKIGIMQPYLLPYIGYFQLINAVDKFVIYDNIEYSKKGWINRNRILVNGKATYFTVPLKKASDYKTIRERYIADTNKKDFIKIINTINSSYSKAPYFKEVFPIVKKVVSNNCLNLFDFLHFSLITVLDYLEINTEIIKSSDLKIDHSLKSQDKVIALCNMLKTDEYINPIGGVELYSKNTFKENNFSLSFIKSNEIIYKQFDNDFIPWLSIIDVMMFNSKEKIQYYLKQYSLQ